MSSHLSVHAVIFFEERPGKGNELPVRGMIDGLHTRDSSGQVRSLVLDVGGELGFRAGGAGNQDRSRGFQRVGDLTQEMSIERGVPTILRVGFMVQVLMRIAAADPLEVRAARVDVENPGLVVIDPDDGMILAGHDASLRSSKVLCR